MTADPADTARRRKEVHELVSALRAERARSPRADELRAQLTEMHLPLVTYLARRFANRNIPLEDLTQVGAIGLIKAVDRFDPDRGVDFAAYATPTILGEIRRHFRDTGWLLHVPRRAQELQSTITRARADLSQQLGRSPTVAELAERIEVSEDLVVEALDVAHGYTGVPIDVLTDPELGGGGGQSVIATMDVGLDNVEMRAVLLPALQSLPVREQEVLLLRFVAGKTQTEIADLIGVSQMQISRLISRSLAQMRVQLGPDPDVDPGIEATMDLDAEATTH